MILKGNVKTLLTGARMMVQLVQCLPHKCEELSLDLQHAQASTEPHVFKLSSGEEAETGEPLELTG